MIEENWLVVPGYEGIYAVSDRGSVMTMDYKGTGLPGLLKQEVMRKGYRRVALYRDQKKKKILVHALVMLAFKGPRPAGMHINHKNGNTGDNALANLEYCTPVENERHAISLAISNGVKKRRSRKIPEDVRAGVLEMFANGISKNELSKIWDLHVQTVRRICSQVVVN